MTGIQTTKFKGENQLKEKVKTNSIAINKGIKIIHSNLEFFETKNHKTTDETILIKTDNFAIRIISCAK